MENPDRILVVDDDPALRELLEAYLSDAGFAVDLAANGREMHEAMATARPDALVLDLMMPGEDGLSLTRSLRAPGGRFAQIPIVMLSARGEEIDRVVGLEVGADDYLAKPFSPREVVLRVKAILRRSTERPTTAPTEGGWLEAGAIRLDPEGHRITVAGEEVALTATELRLLRILLERRGRTQSRATLLSEVWGYAEDVDSRTVDTHIRRLRKKLGSEAHRVETLIGIGYRLKT